MTQLTDKERIACCTRCPPYSHSILYSKEGDNDFVYCDIHGKIPIGEVNEVLLKEYNHAMDKF
jgi:hypothetical protein